jgi:hypothetical protein
LEFSAIYGKVGISLVTCTRFASLVETGMGSKQGIKYVRIAKFGDFIIKGTILLCGVLVLYCINSYGWRPDRYLQNPISAVLYYAFAILVGLLLVSLRLEAPFRISVSIFLVFMTFGIFTTELFLFWSGADLDSIRKLALTAEKMGVKFDTRDKLAVITDLERHNLAAVPNVNPENFLTYAPDGTRKSKIVINGAEILPLAGISNKTTVYCM